MCVYSNRTGDINVADSLVSMNLLINGLVQIAKLYSNSVVDSALRLRRLSVQQQNGFQDCGLFAIAFAVEVCLGHNPEDSSFAQELMRQHLMKCLSIGTMQSFPRMASPALMPKPSGGFLTVKVFCVCKLPAQFDTDMIACDVCDKWFHCSCVSVHPVNTPKYWECPDCN